MLYEVITLMSPMRTWLSNQLVSEILVTLTFLQVPISVIFLSFCGNSFFLIPEYENNRITSYNVCYTKLLRWLRLRFYFGIIGAPSPGNEGETGHRECYWKICPTDGQGGHDISRGGQNHQDLHGKSKESPLSPCLYRGND